MYFKSLCIFAIIALTISCNDSSNEKTTTECFQEDLGIILSDSITAVDSFLGNVNTEWKYEAKNNNISIKYGYSCGDECGASDIFKFNYTDDCVEFLSASKNTNDEFDGEETTNINVSSFKLQEWSSNIFSGELTFNYEGTDTAITRKFWVTRSSL